MNILVLVVLLFIWSGAVAGKMPDAKGLLVTVLGLGFLAWRWGVECTIPTMRDIYVSIGFIVVFYVYRKFFTEKEQNGRLT